MKRTIAVRVNGIAHEHEVSPRLLLVHYLRGTLGLTGTHIGCETSQCGACTIILNGLLRQGLHRAGRAGRRRRAADRGGAGREDGTLHPLQQGFWEKHGLQCGFCTPGMMMAAYNLLQRNPHPTADEIRHALEGNLCRCTGYQNIVDAIQWAAQETQTEQALGSPISG